MLRALRSRFRLRLVLAFVLVAGLSCGGLAACTFVLAQRYRRHSFAVRAEREAQIYSELAPRPLTADAAGQAVAVFERAGGEGAVVRTADGSWFGSSGLGVADVPPVLRAGGPEGAAVATTARIRGRPSLVVARSVDGARWFFVFDQSGLDAGMFRLGLVLAAMWLVIVASAALVGSAVARRALRPVRAASDAARAMAEGVLDTRLSVGPDDEFGRWARYFNDMAAALEAKIKALSDAHERELRFTANVAHELRTPLAAAVNAAAVLESRLAQGPESVRRPAELVIADVHRLRRLAQDLLELARLDAGQEAVANEVVSLTAVVEAVRRAGRWEDAVEVRGSSVWVLADRRRLERVVTNLFANAVEHGAAPVVASIRRHGSDAVLDVYDAGPGIPPEQQQAIFERFYKADGSRSRRGAGLGLAIAAEHTRAMAGSLTLTSSRERGTTFRLRLPAAEGVATPQLLHAGT